MNEVHLLETVAGHCRDLGNMAGANERLQIAARDFQAAAFSQGYRAAMGQAVKLCGAAIRGFTGDDLGQCVECGKLKRGSVVKTSDLPQESSEFFCRDCQEAACRT